MSDRLPVPAPNPPPPALLVLEDEVNAFIAASRAPSTLRAYKSDWACFTRWCGQRSLDHLPAAPATVALYITDLARTMKASTIGRRLSSISVAHQAAGHPSPTADISVRSTLAGIRRVLGTAQVGKDPLLTEDLRAIVSALPDTLQGQRDACLLLLGFTSAMRRSELVALDLSDIQDTADGLVVTVNRSKTDQEGAGRLIGIPYSSTPAHCAVRALRRWVEAADLSTGPLFRGINRHGQLAATRLSDRSVALIIKRSVRTAGLDPKVFAGHSLRSGFATSAARAGATEAQIMLTTGHRSLPVLRRYIRRGSLFTDNAAARLGL